MSHKIFHGSLQKREQRELANWKKDLPSIVREFMATNPSEDAIEDFYTTKVMRYTKDSIEEILKDDLNNIETTVEIVNHFGSFFKPNNK
tara:strand:- start:12318 stop:12584 length:267 start_codon:yes stop_codon:yes gene_type:complete